ncbi:MAG: hypothetical protein NCW75_03955 [Phycisphaera sp.]|nr:MAG: hypothetical protein NCW75_03955 [Phycisphaera sp.]
MAMKPCRDCGATVSTKAKACPRCGARRKKRMGCGTILLAVVGAIVIGGAVLVAVGRITAYQQPVEAPDPTVDRSMHRLIDAIALDDDEGTAKPDARIVALLEDLDEFRFTASFKEHGLGPGGPYHQWLERVEAIQHDEAEPLLVRVAASDGLPFAPEAIHRGSSKRWSAASPGTSRNDNTAALTRRPAAC